MDSISNPLNECRIFMGFLNELLHNQPNLVIGVGVATAVLLGIYIFLLNTYK